MVVEDSPTDRELLRYLLEARFKDLLILEAATLRAALVILTKESVDCVVLDLQLPDSTGKATFTTLYERYPSLPFIVMTHNKDRQLAIDMIQLGAADYVIKNFTDEEELFRRIVFAMEKHRHTVRVPPEDAASVHRLDRAEANLKTAHQSGQHSAIRDTQVEVTSAIADLSRRMFTEMQAISNQVTQVGTNQANLMKTVENLDQEILRGGPGRSSMRSQMDLIDHRLTTVETKFKHLEEKKAEADMTGQQQALQLTQHRMSNRTKIILGVLTLIGVISGAIATYESAVHKPQDPPAATGAKK